MQTQIPKGFTLVELSIVLIIIGLIVSGVVAGKSLIEAAKIRKVISDVNQIKRSVNTFYLKYDQLPGDIDYAQTIWGGSVNNGNNNSYIEEGNDGEGYGAWEHLGLAKLFPGSYSGEGLGNSAPDAIPGVNVPPGPFDKSRYLMWYHGSPGAYGKASTSINFNGGSSSKWGSVLSVTDTYNIDIKMDDGLADSGIMYAAKGYELGVTTDKCTQGTNVWNSSSAVYNLNDTGTACWVFFWLE